uniref:Uncharacterized protein n=1 Tax=Anguilla anguilla TaxID=7936 RepID=A0A0E9QQ31_ANGAN
MTVLFKTTRGSQSRSDLRAGRLLARCCAAEG